MAESLPPEERHQLARSPHVVGNQDAENVEVNPVAPQDVDPAQDARDASPPPTIGAERIVDLLRTVEADADEPFAILTSATYDMYAGMNRSKRPMAKRRRTRVPSNDSR